MKVIVGLGNPGKEYEKTRHNSGFRFVDALARDKKIAPVEESLKFQLEKRLKAEVAKSSVCGQKMIFVKPQSYMNLSGEVIKNLLSYYKIETKDLIIALDDKDLPLGWVRIRTKGGSAGHKGLENIIENLGCNDFTRLRFGITPTSSAKTKFDQPKTGLEASEFVLSPFTKREEPVINRVIAETIDYILPYLCRDDKILNHTIHNREIYGAKKD